MAISGRSVSVVKSVKTDMDIKLDKIELVMQIFNNCRVGEISALSAMANEMKKKK